jgi:hypothetical protein
LRFFPTYNFNKRNAIQAIESDDGQRTQTNSPKKKHIN